MRGALTHWITLLLVALPGLTGCEAPVVTPLIDCNPGHKVCVTSSRFGPITLELSPRPVPLMTPFAVRLIAAGPLDRVHVDFDGRDMAMGPNTLHLKSSATGPWQGEAMLPVCLTGAMRWQATISLQQGDSVDTLRFEFDTATK